jgi:hypothetical protein
VKEKGPKKKTKLKPVGPAQRDSKRDVPIDRLTILLRAYVTRKKQRKKQGKPPRKLRPSDWTLIFDTETKTDQSQGLRFGSYQLRHRGALRERGVFYDPKVPEAEIAIIHTVITQERAQALGERINLMTRAEFVENVFLGKGYDLGALIVGLNLPFDLSRLSIDHDSARKSMKGGFSFVLSERSDRPHLRIKHLNGHSALIDFAATEAEVRSRKKGNDEKEKLRLTERGYFVDLKTLSKTLTGQSHSLKSLSKLLRVKTPKIDADGHGQALTEEYVRYGIRDTQTT